MDDVETVCTSATGGPRVSAEAARARSSPRRTAAPRDCVTRECLGRCRLDRAGRNRLLRQQLRRTLRFRRDCDDSGESSHSAALAALAGADIHHAAGEFLLFRPELRGLRDHRLGLPRGQPGHPHRRRRGALCHDTPDAFGNLVKPEIWPFRPADRPGGIAGLAGPSAPDAKRDLRLPAYGIPDGLVLPAHAILLRSCPRRLGLESRL